MPNQQDRRPHSSGARGSTHDRHTSADDYGKGKVKCWWCVRGKKSEWKNGRWVKTTCDVCHGRGWL